MHRIHLITLIRFFSITANVSIPLLAPTSTFSCRGAFLLLLATGPRQRGPNQLGIPTQLDTDGAFDLGEQGDVGDGSTGFVVGDLAVAKKDGKGSRRRDV